MPTKRNLETCNAPSNLTWLKSLLALVIIAITPTALAQVELTTSVQKVVETLAADGSVRKELVPADTVIPGSELRYTITFTNNGTQVVDAGSIVITNPLPEDTEYVAGTAFGSGTEIDFSVDEGQSFGKAEELMITEGEASRLAQADDYTTIRWTFAPALDPGATGNVSFNVLLR